MSFRSADLTCGDKQINGCGIVARLETALIGNGEIRACDRGACGVKRNADGDGIGMRVAAGDG